jgi:hypothetical protein
MRENPIGPGEDGSEIEFAGSGYGRGEEVTSKKPILFARSRLLR